MPSRGNYEVTSREEGKAAERDQSYKSCILSMLIFILLSIVLILASLPWKSFQLRQNRDSNSDENSIEFAKIEGRGFTTLGTERSVEIEKKQTAQNRGLSNENRATEIPVVTKKQTVENDVPFERHSNNVTTEISTENENQTKRSQVPFERYTENETTGIPVDTEKETVENNVPFERYTNNETTESSIETEKQTMESNVPFERYSNNATSEIPFDKEKQTFENNVTSENYTNSETEELPMASTTENTFRKMPEVAEKFPTTLEAFINSETTTSRIIDSATVSTLLDEENNETSPRDETTSVGNFVTRTRTIGEIDEKSTTRAIKLLDELLASSTQKFRMTERSIDDQTSLQKLLVAKYFGNESTTLKTGDSMEEWLDEVTVGTKEKATELSTSPPTKISSSSRSQAYTNPDSEFVKTTRKTGAKITTPRISTEKTSVPVSQEIQETKIDVCETGSCKQLASKILSQMNHSADPCDDFYEFACGGLEADQQMSEKILIQRVYEKIETQARKPESSKYSQFVAYYDSCLKYESTYNFGYRINLAKRSLEKVGKFYIKSTWPGDFQGFTTLFTNMLRQNRPLLFDIVPDVNEKNPDSFTLKIGPAIDNNPFRSLYTQNQCRGEKSELLQEHVDLTRLYESYKKCKKDSRVIVIAISEALKNLRIFDGLKNPSNETLYLEDTVTNIYHEIIEGILTYFPPDCEIRDSYRSKDYTVTTLGELESTCTLFKWTQLIQDLTGHTLGPNTELQVYHKHKLIRALQRLEKFARNKQAFELNNALLGLYAQNLYQDLVATRTARDLEQKCFDVAAHFMQREASLLYLSSFAATEIESMKNMMQSIFHELKETLSLELSRSDWAVGEGREVLLKKLGDMKMSIPEMSYIEQRQEYNKPNITDNYFENSMTLMKKYRSVMYSVLRKDPSDPEQIWTFFASPYQSNPLTIYGLNLIVVPFGAIDWQILAEKMDYVNFAIIGNLIAREIAHNFDANGVRYWNGTRDSEFALMTDRDLTKTNYEDYMNCQKFSIYQEPLEISIPLTGQRVTFKVPSLTLNERLSDAVGMRLAHDTLVRLGKGISKKRLPCLDLDVSQLFYLVNAQTHCTKESLASSFVSLNEDPLLPSRVRIFVAASYDKNLGESWKCPEGSQLLPTFTCGVFPHLEYRGIMPDAA